MHKNKSKAIALLQAGDNFEHETFQPYWNDPEAYTVALVARPEVFDFVIGHNPELVRDAQFMADLYRTYLINGVKELDINIWEYLPPEITDSGEVAGKAAELGHWGFRSCMAPNLRLNMALRNGFHYDEPKYIPPMSERLYQTLGDEPSLLAELIQLCPELYELVPMELWLSREVALARCIEQRNLDQAFNGLHDDEAFVIEVLRLIGEQPNDVIASASYRIRQLVRGQDNPEDFLEKHLAMTTLSAEVKPKQTKTTEDDRVKV